MKAPFIQPFKNITLPVKVTVSGNDVGTNDGPTDNSRVGKTGNDHKYPLGPDGYMVKNDARYSPVCMKANGNGFASLADGTETVPVIGVLMESFLQPDQPHEIMVEGIVWMEASAAITPGDLVMSAAAATGSNANTRRTRIAKAVAGKFPFGIALQKASKAGDWISVLIGTTGGKM